MGVFQNGRRMGRVLNIKVICLLILCCFHLQQANAVEFDFHSFTTNDGLPHNYITSIYQSSDGFIWLSTRNGICRYDGYNFVNFQTNASDNLGISFIQDIMESDDGTMWLMGPERYLYNYNGHSFKQYSEDYVFAYPDRNGKLWFINDSNLIRVDIASAKFENDNNSDNNNLLKLVFKERNNKVWVFRKFTQKQLINSSRGFYNYYTPFDSLNELPLITKALVDSENILWISTSNNGLYKFNPETEKLNNYSNNSLDIEQIKLSHNSVYDVYEIDSTEMWIATMDGLNILNKIDKSVTVINHDQFSNKSISDDLVTSFLKDKYGNIFVGTRYGFNVLNKRNFKHYYKLDNQNSILSNNVHGFNIVDDENIWIISSGGLDNLNSKSGKIINYPVNKFQKNALKASPISIISDRKENLWIGTWQGGLYYFDLRYKSFKQYIHEFDDINSLSNNNIMSLFIDSKNKLWIGTWGGGLNAYDTKLQKFSQFEYSTKDEASISDNEISCFAEDKYKRLWIGSLNGLNLLMDEKNQIFRHFKYNVLDSSTISNNQINALYVSNDILWIGTSLGLNKLNLSDFSISRVYEEDGLPSNHIKAITADNNNNLWVTTNKGLAKLIINEDDSAYIRHIYTYSTSDGLQDNEFLDRSIAKSPSGEIFIGGTNGFNNFNPETVVHDTLFPDCVFTKLLVDDMKIKVGDSLFGNVILTQALSKTDGITLSYKHRSFSIEFASLNYSKPFDVRYQYMLKGFDQTWINVDSKNRVANYTNINKGEYELLVKFTNDNNTWNDNPVKFSIEVVPPFWKTTWFLILMIVLLGFIVILIIEIRTRMIKNQNKKLEQTVEKRTGEIVKQKEEIKQQADHILKMNDLLKIHNIELAENVNSLSKARVMQKLLDYNEFKKIFSSEKQCYDYLLELKWGKGFSCIRCGSKLYSLEENDARRCKSCNYKESMTSGTIFHHLRFPIDKAFYILIVTSTGRKINVSELSRTLNMRLKTVWFFHSKVKEELKLLKKPIKSDEGWTSLIITPTGKR